ncbi:transposase (plasmid) [Haloferax sp. S1W]|uniref:transposase n=1 Tax=Haloferax sp. S1W TaxID=3377110 RepID=UPI0037CB0E11
MDGVPKSRLLRFVERAMVLARRAVARFSTRYSRKRFTLRQHVVLLCLKVKKTTLLVDTATNAVLDIHVTTTTRKHDTQIAPRVVKRNAASIAVLTDDKGCNDQKLRHLARNHDIRPLTKYREFTPLHKAWNARLDNDLYHRRNMNETVNAAIKQKFGAFVRSRRWWKQFCEPVIKCVVYNLDRSLAISHERGESP